MTKAKTRTEDTKLLLIDFEEWTDKNLLFEESSLYDYFANHQFLCMIFEEPSLNAPLCDNKFIGFKRLSFSEDFIQNDVKKVWNEVRNLIFESRLEEKIILDKEGNPSINSKTGLYKTSINFPKSRDGIVFVRGGSLDSSVKTEEVNGIKMYRQYIWIKGTYIVELLNDTEIL